MTTTTVRGLAADSNDELGVRAVDAAGNGSVAVTIVAATDGEGTDGGGHRGVVPSKGTT